VDRSFTTRAESSGDAVVVHVDGDIDVATSGRLSDDMAELVDTGPELILDLTDVPFMDTVGISALLATRSALLDRGGSFAVRNPSNSVRRALDVTGLAALLIESSEREAGSS
jgi:anti-sigma B factor antagonist